MANPAVQVTAVELRLLPVETRVPLKFGAETLTSVTCARVMLRVADDLGRTAEGWGETPLSVQWVWPSTLSYQQRYQALLQLCRSLVPAWANFEMSGHPLEIGSKFQEQALPHLLAEINQQRGIDAEPVPWLAALVCCSPYDIALHDAYGNLTGHPVYETYGPPFIERDLSHFVEPAAGAGVSFEGKYVSDYLISNPPAHLPAWHLVGGLDPLDAGELSGEEPEDGYPVLLPDWIARDGLKCLKVKLRGTDEEWDYQRLVKVGQLGMQSRVEWLSADFNCTVTDADYVCRVLDRLQQEQARIFAMLLYVEQPFPYDLEAHQIDVHAVSSRKPLYMDESAHDWRLIRLGRSLGWTGVALKTCKTQTGALLSLCWAKAHGMGLMVQDLTNPMLAQLPHVQLAAHAGTIMGVETNAMQFYPQASVQEAAVHPGLYRRQQGTLDLASIQGTGFGYRLSEIERILPPLDTRAESSIRSGTQHSPTPDTRLNSDDAGVERK